MSGATIESKSGIKPLNSQKGGSLNRLMWISIFIFFSQRTFSEGFQDDLDENISKTLIWKLVQLSTEHFYSFIFLKFHLLCDLKKIRVFNKEKCFKQKFGNFFNSNGQFRKLLNRES